MIGLLFDTTAGFLTHFILWYALLVCLSYVILGALSANEMLFYKRNNQQVNYASLMNSDLIPSIAIVAPAYNEERTIVQNVRSLLNLHYPDYQVIIVNDGSSDQSLQSLINAYELETVPCLQYSEVPTKNIRAVYKSSNRSFSRLVVVDKENGGKADALNAGINHSASQLVACIDVDCILESDALLKLVKPFLEEKTKVIAAGGVIRIANSCTIVGGRLVQARVPKNWLARFQVVEYFRAFLVGRMAWSRLNGLLLVSGALGVFDRKIVVACGGYDSETVGEDMELVVRMRAYMADRKLKYKVVYIPDPLCWTEAPSNWDAFSNQRNRWTRGTIETMLEHRKMLFNAKYGLLGLLSFPYWLVFEWLAPIIEFLGIFFATIFFTLGYVNKEFFVTITFLVFAFAWCLSAFAILYEDLSYKQYHQKTALPQLFFAAFLEPFIYHPINMIQAIKGNIDFMFGKRTWGEMKRKGFK